MASSPVGGRGVGRNPGSVNRNRWVNHKVYARRPRRSIPNPNPSSQSQPQESQYPSKTLASTAQDDSLPKPSPQPVSQDDEGNLNLTTSFVNDQVIWKNDTVPVLETPVPCQQMLQGPTPIVDVSESPQQPSQQTVFLASDDVSTSNLKFELDKNELSNTAVTIPVNESSVIPYSVRHPSPTPSTPPPSLISYDFTSQGQKLLTINTDGGSIDEIRNLKRHLEIDLEKVRFYYHKVKAYEIQLSTEVATYPSYSNNSHPFHSGRRSDLTVSVGPNPLENYRMSDDAMDKQTLDVVTYPGYGGNSHMFHGGRRMDLNITFGANPMENYNMGGHSLEKRTPKANQYYQKSEFLLGNEKLPHHPPPSSNKKPKSNKKHGFFQHRGHKVLDQATLNERAFKKCDVLLSKLMKHKHGWVFNEPVKVDEMGLYDYFIIIKNPMDLGTVKSRLSKNWYKSPMDFAEDVRLTFRNATTYNVKGHDVHIMAEILSGIFEKQWASIVSELNPPHPMSIMPSMKASLPPLDVLRIPIRPKSTMQQPMVPELTPKPPSHTPRLQRAPSMKKPKAKDLNKREMTDNEKQKLSTQLESLPNEKLPQVVAIIKKRNSSFTESDGTFEISLETLDTETLWELDRLVSNHKKSRSKNKRREEERANAIRLRQAEELQKNIQQGVANQESLGVEKMMENQADVQGAALSPVGKEKKAETGSGSSSSSSSSGGSSSSDSDSGSSSSSFSSG